MTDFKKNLITFVQISKYIYFDTQVIEVIRLLGRLS